MKIEITKECKVAGKTFAPGSQLVVLNEVGRSLVRQGKAISSEFETVSESVALNKLENDFEEELINLLSLPRITLIKRIEHLQDIELLKEIANDKRKSVRDAAINQLEKMT